MTEDYYLEKCPHCGRYNEELDEKCPACGEILHITPQKDLSDLLFIYDDDD